MAVAPTIAILVHERTLPQELGRYRALRCSEHWRRWGFEVRVLQGITEPPRADLLIPQVNLSVMPGPYRDYLEAHPRVINRGLYDIRKTAFTRNRVTRDDGYEGPVVVKTNANFGGLPEHRTLMRSTMRHRLPYTLRRSVRRVFKKLAHGTAKLAYVDFLEPKDYRVFESKREVPDAVFANPALVVERFRPERHGEQYVSRNCAFFGNAGITVWEKSRQPLIRGDAEMQLEIIPNDAPMGNLRKTLGMDFGKLDYGMVNGEVVLYDVNPTPCSNFNAFPDIKLKIIEEMSRGIFDWFPERKLRAFAGGTPSAL